MKAYAHAYVCIRTFIFVIIEGYACVCVCVRGARTRLGDYVRLFGCTLFVHITVSYNDMVTILIDEMR